MVHRPYFVREGGGGGEVEKGSAERLAQLVGRVVEAEDTEDRFDFHFLIRQHAMQLLADHQPTTAQPPSAPSTADAARVDEEATGASLSLSSLLLSHLSSSPSSAQFMSSFDALMSSQAPFRVHLSSTELRYYDQIAANIAHSLPDQSDALRVSESLVRYWLGVGSLPHSLQAVNFLLSRSSAASSPSLLLSPAFTAYLHRWSTALSSMKAPLLRLSRSKHLTAVSSSARRVSLLSSSSSLPFKPKRPPCGRKWDCEDDTTWDRYDDRTSAILEAAYQAGKPSIDFTVEGKPHTYRADFTRMVQRNLQTGREKPLRSLLALLIREKNGKISQTVEINMPHNTSIRELRRELASYLKWDERQLRMMYANKVLRRIDYSHVTIREGIVPLGAEPLMVTKINKGDLEELCTFTLTGNSDVRQEAWECLTCDFVDGRSFCSICAVVCHKGHIVRLLSPSLPSFCHCGAGAGGHEAPCYALEESPEDREPLHPPSMCASACGGFLYLLTSDMGLVKLGSGGADTLTGKLYAQNSLMAVHAGGCMAEVQGTLLLRSPMVREDILLCIDPHSLLFTRSVVALHSRDAGEDDIARHLASAAAPSPAPPSSAPAASSSPTAPLPVTLLSPSFVLEFNASKLEVEEADEAGKEPSAVASPPPAEEAQWSRLPPFLTSRLCHAFLSNPQYGDVVPSSLSSTSGVAAVSIEEEGLFLRLPSKLGMKRCRVRVKHRQHLQPMFVDGQRTASGQPRSHRCRHRSQGRGLRATDEGGEAAGRGGEEGAGR